MTRDGIYDASGRLIAPPQAVYRDRPLGPWTSNAAPLVRICAWCPDFDRTAPVNAGATHGICPRCAAKVEAEWAA